MPNAFDYYGNSLPAGWMGSGRAPFNAQPGYNRSGAQVYSPNDLNKVSGSVMRSGMEREAPAQFSPTATYYGDAIAKYGLTPNAVSPQGVPMYRPATLHTAGENARLIGDDNVQPVAQNPGANPSFPPIISDLPAGGITTNPTTTTPGGGGAGGGGLGTAPLPGDTPGGYGSNPGSPAFGSITTSITPTSIYTQQQTQRAINQRRALASQAASLPYLLQQTAQQGMGRHSPSAYGRVLPQVGMMQSEINRAPVEQQFADDAANLDHFRAGQVAREQEAQGLAGALLRMQDMNRVLQGTQGSMLASLLSRFA